jgi:hypothetical protein
MYLSPFFTMLPTKLCSALSGEEAVDDGLLVLGLWPVCKVARQVKISKDNPVLRIFRENVEIARGGNPETANIFGKPLNLPEISQGGIRLADWLHLFRK